MAENPLCFLDYNNKFLAMYFRFWQRMPFDNFKYKFLIRLNVSLCNNFKDIEWWMVGVV